MRALIPVLFESKAGAMVHERRWGEVEEGVEVEEEEEEET